MVPCLAPVAQMSDDNICFGFRLTLSKRPPNARHEG